MGFERQKEMTMHLFLEQFPKFFYSMVRYRLHISFFTIILLLSFYETYQKTSPDWVVISVFFIWNFALYLFDRAYDAERDLISQPCEAVGIKEKNALILLSIFLSILPLAILCWFKLPIIPYLFFIPLTFIYTYPIFGNKRIKNFLFIKNLYSAAFIWSLPIVVIALYYVPNATLDLKSLLIRQVLPLFLYIMIGEAFWDIRDVEGDKVNEVYTIPVVFGIRATKIYLYLLLLIDFLTSKFHFSEPLLIYMILIFFINSRSPRWIFHLPPLLALFRWFLSLNLG